MVDKNGAATLAASFLTHENVAAVAADYITWVNAQVTAETAINSLLAAANVSKDPDKVLVEAARYYELFEADPPAITSITPSGGTTAGGTAVTIVGRDFTGATVVSFGALTATSIVIVDDTHITCVTPAKTAGAKDVIVTTPAGSVTSVGGFLYA